MKCSNCYGHINIFRVRRTFIERRITERKRRKYQCGSCHATFFL